MHALNPENVLADSQDYATFMRGSSTVIARKGTVAASIQNAARLRDAACTDEERNQILTWFKENSQALVLIFQDELSFRNQDVQRILDEANKEIDAKDQPIKE